MWQNTVTHKIKVKSRTNKKERNTKNWPAEGGGRAELKLEMAVHKKQPFTQPILRKGPWPQVKEYSPGRGRLALQAQLIGSPEPRPVPPFHLEMRHMVFISDPLGSGFSGFSSMATWPPCTSTRCHSNKNVSWKRAVFLCIGVGWRDGSAVREVS